MGCNGKGPLRPKWVPSRIKMSCQTAVGRNRAAFRINCILNPMIMKASRMKGRAKGLPDKDGTCQQRRVEGAFLHVSLSNHVILLQDPGLETASFYRWTELSTVNAWQDDVASDENVRLVRVRFRRPSSNETCPASTWIFSGVPYGGGG